MSFIYNYKYLLCFSRQEKGYLGEKLFDTKSIELIEFSLSIRAMLNIKVPWPFERQKTDLLTRIWGETTHMKEYHFATLTQLNSGIIRRALKKGIKIRVKSSSVSYLQ